MKKIAVLFFVCLMTSAIGCAASSESDETDPVFVSDCVQAGASYEITFTEKKGGSCGPLSPQVMNISQDKQETLPIGCSNGPKAHTEGCSVYMDQSCKEDYQGMKVVTTFVGKVDWNEDGSGGTGTYTITQTVDGEFHCSSTYSAVAERL